MGPLPAALLPPPSLMPRSLLILLLELRPLPPSLALGLPFFDLSRMLAEPGCKALRDSLLGWLPSGGWPLHYLSQNRDMLLPRLSPPTPFSGSAVFFPLGDPSQA